LGTIVDMEREEFQRLVHSNFKFLIDEFGFAVELLDIPGLLPEKFKGWRLFYQNATTGVAITYDQLDRLPSVIIHKLHGDQRLPLGILIVTRNPELNPLRHEKGFPLSKSPEDFLKEWASALRLLGTDVLRGDFSSFPFLEEELQRRINLRMADPKNFTYF